MLKKKWFLTKLVPLGRNEIMNNNDISNLINMISKMDKNQLSKGVNQLNQMLSNEDKQRIIQALNNKK